MYHLFFATSPRVEFFREVNGRGREFKSWPECMQGMVELKEEGSQYWAEHVVGGLES